MKDNLNKFDNSFDICADTGAASAFFPPGRGALVGTFTEVSCKHWKSQQGSLFSDGAEAWNGACLKGETAANWPAVGCGNQGSLRLASLFLNRC